MNYQFTRGILLRGNRCDLFDSIHFSVDAREYQLKKETSNNDHLLCLVGIGSPHFED